MTKLDRGVAVPLGKRNGTENASRPVERKPPLPHQTWRRRLSLSVNDVHVCETWIPVSTLQITRARPTHPNLSVYQPAHSSRFANWNLAHSGVGGTSKPHGAVSDSPDSSSQALQLSSTLLKPT